jgi:hypothetical protein
MDPAIRERRRDARDARDGRSTEELNANRKKFLIGGAALLAVLAVMGKVGLPSLPVHIDINDDPKGAIVTTADEVARAYADDPEGAAKRFGGREIVVSGEFLRIVPDGYGSIDARLKTPNPDFPLGADLVGQSIEDAKDLKPGQQVTVSCRNVAGSGNDRWLQNCAIQPEAEAAPPSPPAPPAPSPPPPPGQGNSG